MRIKTCVRNVCVFETYNVCPHVARLLCNIYSRSQMHGQQWNSALSTPFPLHTGIKQGECFLQFYFPFILIVCYRI